MYVQCVNVLYVSSFVDFLPHQDGDENTPYKSTRRYTLSRSKKRKRQLLAALANEGEITPGGASYKSRRSSTDHLSASLVSGDLTPDSSGCLLGDYILSYIIQHCRRRELDQQYLIRFGNSLITFNSLGMLLVTICSLSAVFDLNILHVLRSFITSGWFRIIR